MKYGWIFALTAYIFDIAGLAQGQVGVLDTRIDSTFECLYKRDVLCLANQGFRLICDSMGIEASGRCAVQCELLGSGCGYYLDTMISSHGLNVPCKDIFVDGEFRRYVTGTGECIERVYYDRSSFDWKGGREFSTISEFPFIALMRDPVDLRILVEAHTRGADVYVSEYSYAHDHLVELEYRHGVNKGCAWVYDADKEGVLRLMNVHYADHGVPVGIVLFYYGRGLLVVIDGIGDVGELTSGTATMWLEVNSAGKLKKISCAANSIVDCDMIPKRLSKSLTHQEARSREAYDQISLQFPLREAIR